MSRWYRVVFSATLHLDWIPWLGDLLRLQSELIFFLFVLRESIFKPSSYTLKEALFLDFFLFFVRVLFSTRILFLLLFTLYTPAKKLIFLGIRHQIYPFWGRSEGPGNSDSIQIALFLVFIQEVRKISPFSFHFGFSHGSSMLGLGLGHKSCLVKGVMDFKFSISLSLIYN